MNNFMRITFQLLLVVVVHWSIVDGFVVLPNLVSISGRNEQQQQRRKTIHSSSRSSSSSSRIISSNDDLVPGIDTINCMNEELLQKLILLKERPYFRLYSVDILASCEYMPQELFECYTESCEVYPVDEDEVPQEIKQVDTEEHTFRLDGWARWDMPSDDYYDTLVFPESYTGYDGSDIWNFIHDRICFEGYHYDDHHWKADFNKAVSGLHSMISAQVVRGIRDKIDRNEEFTNEEIWTNPTIEFQRRLSPTKGETPLALENLYFCFMLICTATWKAKERLLQDCSSGTIDDETAILLRDVLSYPLFKDPTVAVASKKLCDHATSLSSSSSSSSSSLLWEARMRARELLRIMNCVQCNKCRLHGKISIMGLSTALQILLGDTGMGGDPQRIHRVELATLMTSLYKFSRAIQFCQEQIQSEQNH